MRAAKYTTPIATLSDISFWLGDLESLATNYASGVAEKSALIAYMFVKPYWPNTNTGPIFFSRLTMHAIEEEEE